MRPMSARSSGAVKKPEGMGKDEGTGSGQSGKKRGPYKKDPE